MFLGSYWEIKSFYEFSREGIEFWSCRRREFKVLILFIFIFFGVCFFNFISLRVVVSVRGFKIRGRVFRSYFVGKVEFYIEIWDAVRMSLFGEVVIWR